eukprot:5574863-Pleurochrysis_carterae.AAC.1
MSRSGPEPPGADLGLDVPLRRMRARLLAAASTQAPSGAEPRSGYPSDESADASTPASPGLSPSPPPSPPPSAAAARAEDLLANSIERLQRFQRL